MCVRTGGVDRVAHSSVEVVARHVGGAVAAVVLDPVDTPLRIRLSVDRLIPVRASSPCTRLGPTICVDACLEPAAVDVVVERLRARPEIIDNQAIPPSIHTNLDSRREACRIWYELALGIARGLHDAVVQVDVLVTRRLQAAAHN